MTQKMTDAARRIGRRAACWPRRYLRMARTWLVRAAQANGWPT